jgi:isoleucyl-tRNA synthetase
MSQFYLDIIKDRLYCEGKNSLLRRSAQTAMYLILDALVRMLAPILAFTAEEIWQCMVHASGVKKESVLYNSMPEPCAEWTLSDAETLKWERLQALRLDVNKALELARAEKVIGKALDAEVTLYVSPEAEEAFAAFRDLKLSELFIVSGVKLVSGKGEGFEGENFPGVAVSVVPSPHEKCVRCWNRSAEVGQDSEHPALCARCAAVVRAM